MDPASSEFYADGKYRLRSENLELDAAQMTAYYQRLVQDFPIVLIEDGLAEDDWAGWRILSDARATGGAGRRRSVRHQREIHPARD